MDEDWSVCVFLFLSKYQPKAPSIRRKKGRFRYIVPTRFSSGEKHNKSQQHDTEKDLKLQNI